MGYIFPLLLISHVLGDGLFGSKRLAELKRDRRLAYRLIAIASHTLPHAICAGGLMLLVGQSWLQAGVLVFVFHSVIDLLRCKVDMKLFGVGGLEFHRSLAYLMGRGDAGGNPGKKTLRTWFAINVADQVTHLASLLVIARTL